MACPMLTETAVGRFLEDLGRKSMAGSFTPKTLKWGRHKEDA